MCSCFRLVSPAFQGGTWTLKQVKPSLVIIMASGGFLFLRHMRHNAIFDGKEDNKVISLGADKNIY